MSLFSMSLFENFEELARAYSLITDIARKDRLTGIFNRFGMEDSVKNRKTEPCYAVMIDIDFFKKVNDTYGHEAGDEVLVTFASILKKHAASDFLVSRYGGEEFLIYSFTDYEKTLSEVRGIYADVERSLVISGSPVHISVGISARGCVSEDLIADADRNLYRSKETGRNKISYNMGDVA